MLTKYSLGYIEFEVPSSWSVREADSTLEIIDAQARGAFHLSFLKRTRTDAPEESDARLLVENFALNNSLAPEGKISSTANRLEARAIGRFRPSTPTSETPLHWLLACVVWRDGAVRASYCADSPNAESLELVTGIIESIRRKAPGG